MADIRNGNIRETRRIDLDGVHLTDVDARLDAWAEGLTDARIEIDIDWNYGDPFVAQNVTGWRPATAAEIEANKAERAAAEAQRRQWQERQAAELRIERPDLFT